MLHNELRKTILNINIKIKYNDFIFIDYNFII